MIRRILKLTGWAIALALLLVTGFLGYAHWHIRQFDAPLPADSEIATLLAASDKPTAISVINTATQNVPGNGVFAYPSFVLQWADGRIMVVDAGMERDGALEFGAFLERVAGAEPIVAHGSVGEQLGGAAGDVNALVFTHLHDDHTGGLPSLCADGRKIIVFRTVSQARFSNYTTRNGYALLANNACVQNVVLADPAPLVSVAKFSGVALYGAGGHTPGSTIVLAAVGSKLWVLAGDIANHKSAITKNLAKPFWYSLLATPEDTDRLQDLRIWLAGLDAAPIVTVVVSHDFDALAASGLPGWSDVANAKRADSGVLE